MPNSSKPVDAGYAALRDLRRALVRATVISGSLAVLVLVAFGHGSDRAARFADADMGVDQMLTGSIPSNDRYVVSRSVLQPAGSGPCLYFPDGSKRGSC
jgi:hypothetical protein